MSFTRTYVLISLINRLVVTLTGGQIIGGVVEVLALLGNNMLESLRNY
jgi:hypothetical protein